MWYAFIVPHYSRKVKRTAQKCDYKFREALLPSFGRSVPFKIHIPRCGRLAVGIICTASDIKRTAGGILLKEAQLLIALFCNILGCYGEVLRNFVKRATFGC